MGLKREDEKDTLNAQLAVLKAEDIDSLAKLKAQMTAFKRN